MSARFPVRGAFERAKPADGMVLIDRKLSLFSVRQRYSHRTYTLPLSTVAEIVVAKVLKMDLTLKILAAKAARKKGK